MRTYVLRRFLQMIPLLFVHTPAAAMAAAVVMGLMGGLASAAYVDLAIRSCPEGLQATMMMLVITVYWISVRFAYRETASPPTRRGCFPLGSSLLVDLCHIHHDRRVVMSCVG